MIKRLSLLTVGTALLAAAPAFAQDAAADAGAVPAQSAFVFNTLLFLIGGFLVMWMAAGFAMLEAGLVRAKNTTEILAKNVALFAIACIMYLVCGYSIMYDGGIFLNGSEAFDLAGVLAVSAVAGFYVGPW